MAPDPGRQGPHEVGRGFEPWPMTWVKASDVAVYAEVGAMDVEQPLHRAAGSSRVV